MDISLSHGSYSAQPAVRSRSGTVKITAKFITIIQIETLLRMKTRKSLESSSVAANIVLNSEKFKTISSPFSTEFRRSLASNQRENK